MRFLLMLILLMFSVMSDASDINLSTFNITLEQSVYVSLDAVYPVDLEIDQGISYAVVEQSVEQNKLNKNNKKRVLANLSKRSEYRHLGVNHPLLKYYHRC